MKYVFLLVCSSIGFEIIAQRNEVQYLSPPVSEVKIHLTNAEVIHKQSINLAVGKTKVIITGLSPKINLQSVRADLDKHFDSFHQRQYQFFTKPSLQPRNQKSEGFCDTTSSTDSRFYG